MATIKATWRSLALMSVLGFLTLAVFAQSAQPTEARYMTPQTCSQLQSACEHPMMSGERARTRVCSIYKTLCDWDWQGSSSAGPLTSRSCIAKCPDGYQYRTCSEDGSPIYYFADPCLNHYGSSSSQSALSCSPSNIRCAFGYDAVCADGNNWRCVPWFSASEPSSSASSVTTGGAPCGTSQILCIQGTFPQCIDGNWQCRASSGVSSSSSSSPNSCIAKCADGYEYRTCTEDGHPINYFVDPCFGRGTAVSSSSVGMTCEASQCGPQLGMPNSICADGTVSGPTGRCLRQPNGACGWEVRSCPASLSSSSRSSSSSSSLSLGCYCGKIYQPVCGANGQTYGNYCEARCANATVSHEGVCGAQSSSRSSFSSVMCPVYDLAAPPAGCRYVYEKNSRGCDVPRLVCSGSSSSSSSSRISSKSSSSIASVQAAGGCKVAGCSGQLCVEEGSDGISTCEWRPQYACYRTATCQRQPSGQCGWNQTQELQSCLANPPQA
jgi:hypothetical protein